MKKVKSLVDFTSSEWKLFEGEVLPQSAIDYLQTERAFRSGYGRWLIGACWYKGETPETATVWAIVMDDGDYYKVKAKYAFWHQSLSGKLVMQCSWTLKHLKANVKIFLETGDTILDPDYHT